MSDQASDELAALLSRVALGDRAAFRRVYELTHAHLLAVALKVLRRQDVSEEVLQEVYVAVWQRAQTYAPGLARPMTWLITLVRHRAIDWLRSGRSSASLEQALPESADGEDPLAQVAAAESDLAGNLDALRIQPCMNVLSASQRQSLALAYYQGLSHSEVAEQLTVPVGSVKTWIRRGLEQLRRCLDGGGTAGAL